MLRLSAAAETDLKEARDWYAALSPSLDDRFAAAIRAALAQVGATPLLFPIVHRRIRRAMIRGFPYSILFRIEGEVVLVIGVVHQARHPRVWRRRG